MKIPIDTHTHSICGGHAFSTLEEMVCRAREKGIEMFALTEHTPSMPDGAYIYLFNNLEFIPPYVDGVRVLRGAELNILDFEGTVDLPEKNLKKLEFVVASMHDACIEPGSQEQNTAAMVGALRNPYVDVIGHPGSPQYELDVEAVVLETLRQGKLVEVNNHSFLYRAGSEETCRTFIRLCKRYGLRVAVASDAHISFEVGEFTAALAVLQEEEFPEQLIVNASRSRFEQYLQERTARIERTKERQRE
ncbi:MAG: phosphatase [Christensenellales bacterium]